MLNSVLLLFFSVESLLDFRFVAVMFTLMFLLIVVYRQLSDIYKIKQGKYVTGSVIEVVDKIRVSIPNDSDATSNYDVLIKIEQTGEVVTFFWVKLKRPSIGSEFKLMPDKHAYNNYRMMDENPISYAWAQIFIVLTIIAAMALGYWYIYQ